MAGESGEVVVGIMAELCHHYEPNTSGTWSFMAGQKTLRKLLIHAFRQKPLWWIRSTAPLSACPGKPGLGHLGDCRGIHGAHTPFGTSSILLFKPATTASRVSLNPSSP